MQKLDRTLCPNWKALSLQLGFTVQTVQKWRKMKGAPNVPDFQLWREFMDANLLGIRERLHREEADDEPATVASVTEMLMGAYGRAAGNLVNFLVAQAKGTGDTALVERFDRAYYATAGTYPNALKAALLHDSNENSSDL